jgi:hypothetical protein
MNNKNNKNSIDENEVNMINNIIDLEESLCKQFSYLMSTNTNKFITSGESLGFLYGITERYIRKVVSFNDDNNIKNLLKYFFIKTFGEDSLYCSKTKETIGGKLFDISKFYLAEDTHDNSEFMYGYDSAMLYPESVIANSNHLSLWEGKVRRMENLK